MSLNPLEQFNIRLDPRGGQPGIRVVKATAVDDGPPIQVTAVDTETHQTLKVTMVSADPVEVDDEIGLVNFPDGHVVGILMRADVLPDDFLERNRCQNVVITG